MTVQSIEGLQDEDESRITLTTQTSGESKLEVTLDDGTVDFIRMSVTKAAHSEIEPFPWDSLIPLDATLWASGMSILPNTNLTLFGHMKSISGQRLTGHHALPWHVETTGDATLSVDDMSDFSVFTSGTTPATNEISFGETRLPIPTISAEDVSGNQVNFTIPKSHRTGRLPSFSTLPFSPQMATMSLVLTMKMFCSM